VAQKVFLESVRKPAHAAAQPARTAADSVEREREYECLERCMERLPQDSRELVLEYYRDEKRAKIDRRKELAERLGIAPNALRIRAHRIRVALQRCVLDCLDEGLAA
jgi:DNA-directed RNA polymerase specialized sigma24 family protein